MCYKGTALYCFESSSGLSEKDSKCFHDVFGCCSDIRHRIYLKLWFMLVSENIAYFKGNLFSMFKHCCILTVEFSIHQQFLDLAKLKNTV